MSTYPSVIELSALDGLNGFRIGGTTDDVSGSSVAAAGDVNGDGFTDLIIGAPNANGHAGATYVVFGASSGFSSSLELSGLDGADGFRIDGVAAGDMSGAFVASAGDVNGDGLADLVIGAPNANGNAGATYVVFGTSSSFSSSLELSSLDGTNGFRIDGVAAGDMSGASVAAAGDVNGDGFADLIIGTYRTNVSYVVFGGDSAFSSSLALSALDGSNGFRIDGVAAGDNAGYSVGSAADINGDGRSDLIIGAYGTNSYAGATYVVFGGSSSFSSSLELSGLDGTNGFRIDGVAAGDISGASVASAGDVNGDGLTDLIIGAPNVNGNAGVTYVVFGASSGFSSSLELSALNGSNGFRIDGVAAGDDSGSSVASAGDVNGDGFADLIIGARLANSAAGATYVVFGGASGFSSSLELSGLDGSNGFRIDAPAGFRQSGYSVASASDLNGDGFADLIVGAPAGNGVAASASYVIYGSRPLDDVLRQGTDIANRINGGYGNDTVDGLSGNDTLIGWEGRDLLHGGSGNDLLYGGSGGDTLMGAAGRDQLFGGSGADHVQGGGGRDLLRGGGGADHLDGGDGNDTLAGDGGNDTLLGASGADNLNGGIGSDLLAGGSGADTLNGGGGNDTLTGGSGANRLNGGAGSDNLRGGADNDLLNGGGGADTLNGGGGNDTLAGGSGANHLYGGAGSDDLRGGANSDLVNGGIGADLLSGHGGDDALHGDDGHDTISGGSGNDTLNGGGGHDTIIGGKGNDHLAGGAMTDTFTFSGNFGHDTITDFSANNREDIDLSGVFGITGFRDLVAHHLIDDPDGSDFAAITDGTSNTILIAGFTKDDFGAGHPISGADFIFS